MAEIRKLVDKNNVQFFPVTHINAVVGSDNTSLSEELASKQDAIEAIQVNVDGTSGTPSGSASMSGNTLQFSFSGLKGEPGENAIGFEDVSSQQDGTVVITLTDGSKITIDLNHVHPMYPKYVLLTDEAAYNALATKESDTLYLIPTSSS